MSEKVLIKRRSPINFIIIGILSISVGFYGLDSVLMSARSIATHLGSRTLPDSQIEKFVLARLAQFGLDGNDPAYVETANHLANAYKEQWLKEAKLAAYLEKEGFEPPSSAIYQQLKKEHNITSENIERLASRLGMSSAQFILTAQDQWRKNAFTDLLRQTDLVDPYSTKIAVAINGQKRDYTRYQINLPKPDITDEEVKAYYETNKSALVAPASYTISFLEVNAKKPTAKESGIKQANEYFKNNPALAPRPEYLSFVLSQNKQPGYIPLQTVLSEHTLSVGDSNTLKKLTSQKYLIYPVNHDGNVGLEKRDDVYLFKAALPVPEHETIKKHLEIVAETSLEKIETAHKELVFTSESLSPVASALDVDVQKITVTAENIQPNWPKSELLAYLQSADAKDYNSPILRTTKPSLIVVKLLQTTPERTLSLDEASDQIKAKLTEDKLKTDQAIFSVKLMGELSGGKVSDQSLAKIKKTSFSIPYTKLADYQFIDPILYSFFYYQSQTNPHPAFSLNGSVAVLEKVSYPELTNSYSPEQIPTYMAPSVVLVNELAK